LNSFPKALLIAVVGSFVLAGCQTIAQETPSPSPTAEATQTPSTDPPAAAGTAPSVPSPVSAQESLDLFETAAKLSCETALEKGITEKSVDGRVTMVMVGEQDAIESHSAAYMETGPPKNYVLVLEADMFAVCGAHFSFVLASDAESEVKIAAELEPDGSFFVIQDFGEFGMQAQSYVLEDGLFQSVITTYGDQIRATDLVYGKPAPEDLEILQIASDQLSVDY
jgi:hypothetical protein